MPELLTLIQYGTPVVLLGLIISNVRLNLMVGNLTGSIKAMKDKVTWGDECGALHKGVDGRLDRLELQMNSRGGYDG